MRRRLSFLGIDMITLQSSKLIASRVYGIGQNTQIAPFRVGFKGGNKAPFEERRVKTQKKLQSPFTLQVRLG